MGKKKPKPKSTGQAAKAARRQNRVTKREEYHQLVAFRNELLDPLGPYARGLPAEASDAHIYQAPLRLMDVGDYLVARAAGDDLDGVELIDTTLGEVLAAREKTWVDIGAEDYAMDPADTLWELTASVPNLVEDGLAEAVTIDVVRNDDGDPEWTVDYPALTERGFASKIYDTREALIASLDEWESRFAQAKRTGVMDVDDFLRGRDDIDPDDIILVDRVLGDLLRQRAADWVDFGLVDEPTDPLDWHWALNGSATGVEDDPDEYTDVVEPLMIEVVITDEGDPAWAIIHPAPTETGVEGHIYDTRESLIDSLDWWEKRYTP